MPSDYAAIRDVNKAEYGNVARWGPGVLVNRYDSTAHFIFEILQNAEDALKRRPDWTGSRAVRFHLSGDSLQITHCGNPFTLDDVKGVCGVGETTKDLTDIGRFGIGFKSVYSVTQRPQVHSGDEDFAIESFVFPVAVTPVIRDRDETVFLLPLQANEPGDHAVIAEGMAALSPRSLLFLRQIDEIAWSVEGGSSGCYVKGRAEHAADGSRRVSIVGEVDDKRVHDESWLIYSREVYRDSGEAAGHVEIAFLLEGDGDERPTIRRLNSASLVAFFPTVLPTHMGFLVQGPYRTTPSRDNVPPGDPWNVYLVEQTAGLLIESLEALKANGLLDVTVLQCLPLNRGQYDEAPMFAPLFTAVYGALSSRDLLPRSDGGWTHAAAARLASTQELRDLFDSRQLGQLVGVRGELHWLTGEISRHTASNLRTYLLQELRVTEFTPEHILPLLSRAFLEAQSDEWIVRLYEFLAGQPALRRQKKFMALPLVRLENGSHVMPEAHGQPLAFLPSKTRTDFPLVRQAVCGTTKSLEFLRALGLTEPDAVDDVVRNLLPKYASRISQIDRADYEADVRRILNAYDTQHRGQQAKLLVALREASFVMAVDLGYGTVHLLKPGEVYLATERLTALLAGVAGAKVVDDSYECLRGNAIRELLEACGASRSLIQQPVECSLTWDQREALRRDAGCENFTSHGPIEDHTLRCLPELLTLLPSLSPEERRQRAQLLWDAMKDVEERRGSGAFSATYSWFYYQWRKTPFDPAFIRALKSTLWVPDAEGELQRPEFVTLESLGWTPHPFLASKIPFKKPIIDQLATEAGIDPKVLEILQKRGLTSVEDLIAAIGAVDERTSATAVPEPATRDNTGKGTPTADGTSGSVDDAIANLLGAGPQPSAPVPDPASNNASGNSADGGSGSSGNTGAPGGVTGRVGAATSGAGRQAKAGSADDSLSGWGRTDQVGESRGGGRRTPGSVGGRPFISYLGAHPDDEGSDPDALDQQARINLEENAIALILAREPQWRRTPTHNPGFDLFEAGPDGAPRRWCEVKAMTGTLEDRPVGLSRTQFECACEHGPDFWLYVIERAGASDARIVRIQDPAGKSRTFTFDHGWRAIAEANVSLPERPQD